MLTRQLVRSSLSKQLRPFSSTTILARAPALADITPEGVASFDAKQKEFRERIAEQSKKKEASQLFSSSTSTSPSPPPQDTDSPISVDKVISGSLGSLSTSSDIGTAENGEDGKKGGRISSLIYGTKEGREMDKEIEHSFSQVLARGKYVHSIVFHEVKPENVDEYVALVGQWYPKMAALPENKVHLVGSWRTEVGDCDTFGRSCRLLQLAEDANRLVHIWEYQRYHGYHDSLHNIASHPDFPAFDKKLKSLITSKRNSLMQEFSFWPTTPPRQLGGVFELRSYTLHPGNLLEWETHWRRGLKARREVMEGVGAWFVQIGELNTVHHLWQFADLEERKVRREKSWSVEGWGDTVHKTVPLIQSMKSRILIPMPWSPVA